MQFNLAVNISPMRYFNINSNDNVFISSGDDKMGTAKLSEEERSETESPPTDGKTDSYRCGQCQYKTSRLASLNKHMRVRSHLPNADSELYLIQKPCKRETYCQGCNIQFSSMNTYSAHKEFYCTKRNQHPDTIESDNGTDTFVQRSPRSPVKASPARPVTALLSPGSTGSLSPESKLLQEQSVVILTAPVFMPNGITSMTFSVPSVLVQSSPLPERMKGDRTPPKICSSPRELASDKPLDLSTKRKATNTDISDITEENKVNEMIKSPISDDVTLRTSSKNTHGQISHAPNAHSPAENLSVNKEEKSANGSYPSKNVSKCNECNIVFYKFENFLIHKEHYCLSRRGKKFIPAHSVAETKDQSPGNVISPNMDIVGGCSNSQVQHADNVLTLMTRESAAPHLQYKCLHCNIRFSSVDTLKAHKQYYCPHDKTSERSVSSPESHDEGPDSAMEELCYSCPQCNNAFSTNRLLRQHYCSKSTKTSLKCLYCDHIANSDNRMADHIKVHVPSKAYRCTLCGYRGNTSRGMRMHGKMHVDNGEEFSEINMVEYEEPPTIPAQMNTSSDHSLLDPEAELIRLKNEPYKRRRSRKSFEKSDFSSSSPFLPTTGCICMLCGDALPDPNSFLIHMRLHELSYIESHMVNSCKSCDFVAESKETLSSHMKVAHDRTFSRHELVETMSDTVKCESSKPDSTTPVANPDSNTEGSGDQVVKIKEEPMDSGYETREEFHQTVDIKQEKYSDIESCTKKRCRSAPTSTIPEISSVPAKRCTNISSPTPSVFDDVSLRKPTEATSSDKESAQSIRECGSPSALRKRKQNEDINRLSIKVIKSEATSPNSPSTIHSATFQIIPFAASVPPDGTTQCERDSVDTKYCKRCDISFTYLSSFIAHKKYYCVGRPSEEFPHLAIA